MASLSVADWVAIIRFLAYSVMAVCFCIGVMAGRIR